MRRKFGLTDGLVQYNKGQNLIQILTKKEIFCVKISLINTSLNPLVSGLALYVQSSPDMLHKGTLQNTKRVSLFSTYVSSTCFGPHRSIIRSVYYKPYSQIWYVVIRVLLDTSSSYEVVLQLRNAYYHIPNLRIRLVINAPDDGPGRSETCPANISAE